MLVEVTPKINKLLEEYDGDAVSEAIYAENPKGYAYPSFIRLADAIRFAKENPDILKPTLRHTRSVPKPLILNPPKNPLYSIKTLR